MKAVVWHGVGDIRLDTVADPKLEQDTDALVRITRSAICGTDLRPVLGHEAVGVVEETGGAVRGTAG